MGYWLSSVYMTSLRHCKLYVCLAAKSEYGLEKPG